MTPRRVPVRLSRASLLLRFHGCTPEYIRDVCHGRCCRSSSDPSGVSIAVLPGEAPALRTRGATVSQGYLQPSCGRCPFQGSEGLCGLHTTPDKPFGCIASPFVLTSRDTLIVRNRYKLLKCHRDWKDQGLPAYVAFRASLDLLFGSQAELLIEELTAPHLSHDPLGWMERDAYASLRALSDVRKTPLPLDAQAR